VVIRRFTRIADGTATAYTVGVERLVPDDDPELEPRATTHRSSRSTRFGRRRVVTDYDVHRLARALPGDAGWSSTELPCPRLR